MNDNMNYTLKCISSCGRPTPRRFQKCMSQTAIVMSVFFTIVILVDIVGSPLEKIKTFSNLYSPGHKYINPHSFPYIINNQHFCDDTSRLKYIIYVYSQPKNFYRRHIMRNTWAQNNLFPDWPSKTIFVMGAANDSSVQQRLQKESKEFADIIQEDFVDSYQNLTYMGVAALKWITHNCDKSEYVIKADDDAYINMFEMRMYLENNVVNRTHWFLCYLFRKGDIRRNPEKCAKWCVPEDQFPGQRHFPPYCAGGAYVQDGSMVAAMYNQSLNTPFFWIEDVFMTSLVVTKIFKDVTYLDIKGRYRFWAQDFNKQFAKHSKNTRQWIVGHLQNDEERLKAWTLTLKDLKQEDINLLGDIKYRLLQTKLYG